MHAHHSLGFIELEPLAIGAVDLVWVIVALAGLLFLFAGWVVFAVLNAVLGSISIFGFHPFGFIAGLLEAGMKKVANLLDSKVRAFGEFVWSMAQTMWRFAYVVTVGFGGLLARDLFVHTQAQTGITREAARAQYIEGQLRQDYDQQINQLRASTDQAVAGIEQREAQDVAGLTRSLTGEADARLAGDQYLQGEINTLKASIPADLSSLLSADVQNLTQQIANTRTQLEQEITNGIAGAEQTAARDLTAAEQFATLSISTAAPGIVAQAVAAMQPPINAIKTDLTECLDPLCDTVTPNANQLGNLGKLLKDLEGLFAAGALMALLVAAVEDPKQTARVIVDTTGWMSEAALGLVDVVGSAAGVNL